MPALPRELPSPALSLPSLETLLDLCSPRWRSHTQIVSLGPHAIVVAMPVSARMTGTSAAPIMALADRAAYFLTLALAGPVPEAVTSNLAIQFVGPRGPGELRAEATMVRLDDRFAISTVDVHAGHDLVAHATVTYALPRRS